MHSQILLLISHKSCSKKYVGMVETYSTQNQLVSLHLIVDVASEKEMQSKELICLSPYVNLYMYKSTLKFKSVVIY